MGGLNFRAEASEARQDLKKTAEEQEKLDIRGDIRFVSFVPAGTYSQPEGRPAQFHGSQSAKSEGATMQAINEDGRRFYLRLDFEVLLPITELEFYQGVYWSAMLRDWIRPYVSEELHESGIYPIPGQNGFREFRKGEVISLDLSVPAGRLPAVVEMLEDELGGRIKSTFPAQRLHFFPGKSIRLTGYNSLPEPDSLDPASWEDASVEASGFATEGELELIFHTPLRLKPVSGYKGAYRYLDPLGFDSQVFFSAFCREMGLDAASMEFPELSAKGLIWLDVPYEKTLGGLIGGIRLAGPVDQELLQALIWGQYRGIGKNRGFGFGFYLVKGSALHRAQNSARAGVSWLERGASLTNLETTLEAMRSGSPGPDNLAREDLLSSGRPYLQSARKMLLSGSLQPGETLSFYKRSSSGNHRVISIQNIHERHLLLAVLRQIDASLDRLLGSECYSYRAGRDYHQAARNLFSLFQRGFATGLKGDIKSFFDSIPRSSLRLLLAGLFAADPVADLISSYMLSEGTGIPQGNPLSPLLSNLYLIPFDREIKNRGWRLIRYGDDFCVLADQAQAVELRPDALAGILGALELELSAEKTLQFSRADSLVFLGYNIDQSQYQKIKRSRQEDHELPGIPAFEDDFARGKPLYVTFKESHVRHDNGAVVIEREGESRYLAWKEISRIIVVGKPRISAGVIQQALLRQKPVVFMTVMGRQLGGFAHNQKLFVPQSVHNPVNGGWNEFSLDFVRDLVAAKIHNQRMVLQQHQIREPRLRELELSLAGCADPNVLRGKEGAASVVYWQHFRELVKPLAFPRRAYHPPEGPVNAMLSLGYSILYFRMAESLAASQLNPWEGIFHEPRGLHCALASDLIESFRFLVDRMVLSLVHNRQIGPDDFIGGEDSSFCRLSPDAMKSYIHRYEFTMRNEVSSAAETVSWAILIDRAPAQLMRCLRLGLRFRPYRLP